METLPILLFMPTSKYTEFKNVNFDQMIVEFDEFTACENGGKRCQKNRRLQKNINQQQFQLPRTGKDLSRHFVISFCCNSR